MKGEKNNDPPNPTIKDCIELNQLMPVENIDKNIDAISTVIYDNDDLLNEFLQKVDNRIKVNKQDEKGYFLECEQNRDGDSYRSPWTNKYFPPTNDARYPSEDLRCLEEKFNIMFKQYTKLYYGVSGLSSVYCWELSENIKDGFGVAVLIRNSVDHQKCITTGSWDSSNLITVTFEDDGGKIRANYSLITSVNLMMGFQNQYAGNVSLSGTISRSAKDSQIISDYINDEHHIEYIGVLVENMETDIRGMLDVIYVHKSKEIIDTARENPVIGKPGIKQALELKKVWREGMPKNQKK